MTGDSSDYAPSPASRRLRWERQAHPETGEEQIRVVDVSSGEIIATVRSLFEAWLLRGRSGSAAADDEAA